MEPKTKPSELKPGETTAWKNGRRYYKAKDSTVTVQARVYSSLLQKYVLGTFDSVADAKNWQASQRTGRVHGQEIDPRRAKQPFAVIAAEWLASDPSKSTESRNTDRNRLVGTGVKLKIDWKDEKLVVTLMEKPTDFAALPIGRIRRSDVIKLVNGWKATYSSAWTIRGMYGAVRAVFHFAEGSAIPKHSSPCEDVEVPKPPKTPRPVHRPDDADLDEFVGVFSLGNDDLIRLAEELGPDYGLMVWIAVCWGLRSEEIAGLTIASVENLLVGEIKVNRVLDRQGNLKDRTKTDAGNRSIVDRDLAAEIGAHMARRGLTLNDNPDTKLFVSARGGPLRYSSWRTKFWIPALHRAGLAKKKSNGRYLGLHDLRSMNRSIMNAQGVDLTTARERFGHANGDDPQSRMDDQYSRTSPAQRRLASEKIHAVVRRVSLEKPAKTGE